MNFFGKNTKKNNFLGVGGWGVGSGWGGRVGSGWGVGLMGGQGGCEQRIEVFVKIQKKNLGGGGVGGGGGWVGGGGGSGWMLSKN